MPPTFRSFAIFALLLTSASAQLPPQTYRIAGLVQNSKSGTHLAQARVFLTDVKNPKNIQSQLTTDDGHFAFDVPAGKFALRGAKRGYISANYNEHEQFSTAIVTGVDLDTESLILQLAPTALLLGKVLDERGDPVRQAMVTLWREDHSTGISQIIRFQNDVTDDQGTYEFSPLDSGTYFLSVSGNPWYAVHPPRLSPENSPQAPVLVDRSLDVVYPITYYAGATESDDATPIPIRGGDRQEIELHLLPVPALHVLFHTGQKETGSNENVAYQNPRFQKRVFDEVEYQQGVEAQMTSPGVFEITAAPGKYSMRIDGPQGAQTSEVDLSQDHQELDNLAGEAISNVTVSVHPLDNAPLPDQLFLGFLDRRGRGISFQQVNDKREAQFPELAPGTYDFSVRSPNKAYSVLRISSQGRETPGHTLKVDPGSTLSVDVFVASGSAKIEGFVKQGEKPVAGAMVVLVPKHPDSSRDLFRRDQSDLDGSFTMQAVIPGTYTVIAIADGWDLDWSQPAVLARYAAHGQTIVVPPQSTQPLKLPAPVELQSK